MSDQGVRQGQEWGSGLLRPVDGPDACHTVLEAMSPEAGHVIVHYLHLAATESWVLKQMQLMIGTILAARSRSEPTAFTPRTGVKEAQDAGKNQVTTKYPPPQACCRRTADLGSSSSQSWSPEESWSQGAVKLRGRPSRYH